MIHLHRRGCELSTVATASPITPWPSNLTSNHLTALISRQTDPLVSLQIFHYATAHHPHIIPSPAAYVSLITNLSRARLFHHVTSLLHHLKNSDNLKPPETIFTTLINHYGLANRPNDAVLTFVRIPYFKIDQSIRTFNCLLNALVITKKFDLAHLLLRVCKSKFNVMPNLVSCNILVKALCKKGDLVNAMKVLDEMPCMGIIPNLVTYTTVLGGYVKFGDLKRARGVFEMILGKGYVPDTTTYTCLIDGYCRAGEVGKGVRVMDEMEDNGVKPNEVTYGVVIEALCKEKKGGEAMLFLEDMLKREWRMSKRKWGLTEVLCGKVVDVLCEERRVEDAIDVWKKCLEKKVVGDDRVLSLLVHWLCKEGRVKEARNLVGEFEKRSLEPSLLTYNVLIERLCDIGELSEVRKLWDDMVERGCKPNTFSYHLMFKGFCNTGDKKEAIRVLNDMFTEGYSPSESTCRVLIEGLSCLGLEGEVMKLLSLVADSGGKVDAGSWKVILSDALADVDTGEIVASILSDTCYETSPNVAKVVIPSPSVLNS